MTLETVIWWSGKGMGGGIYGPNPDLVGPVVAELARKNKPKGGLWTSPEETEYGWGDWCRDNEPDWLGTRWRLHITGTPKVLRIDSSRDLDAAFRRWPVVDRWHPDYEDLAVDWEAVGLEYDAVLLTARGHWQTRLPRDINAINTYSWDCDTVLWYRWCFGIVEAAPEAVAA